MKRHIPGLHGEQHSGEEKLEGAFLARVDRVLYRVKHPERPFYVLRFVILEPNDHQGRSFTGHLRLHPKGCVETPLVLAGLSAMTPT